MARLDRQDGLDRHERAEAGGAGGRARLEDEIEHAVARLRRWVIGIRCGWLQLDPVTRPRTRTTSRPPLRSERSTSTLVTKTTGAGGPPTVPDGWPG